MPDPDRDQLGRVLPSNEHAAAQQRAEAARIAGILGDRMPVLARAAPRRAAAPQPAQPSPLARLAIATAAFMKRVFRDQAASSQRSAAIEGRLAGVEARLAELEAAARR